MKPSRNDLFDFNLCMRGLGNLVTHMHSEIYEYVYYFTFKKSLKSYQRDFSDPWEQHLEDDEFFRATDDPVVICCLDTMQRLVDYKLKLNLIFQIDEMNDLRDEMIITESTRFQPYLLTYKHSKSYRKLKGYYERTLSGFINSLLLYACALTAQSNKIPLVLKRQLKLPGATSLRLLNQDDVHVEMLKELTTALMRDLETFSILSLPKTLRRKSEQEKKN